MRIFCVVAVLALAALSASAASAAPAASAASAASATTTAPAAAAAQGGASVSSSAAGKLTSDVAAILQEIDAVNRFSESFTAVMRIASYSPDGPPSLSSYRMYSKGLRKVLMVYLEPSKDAGKKIAMNGESLWFYFPRAKQAMLIRPMNTLTGSVAVGDMIGQPVLDLYDFAGSERVVGGVALSFSAKGTASPYGKVVYEYREGRIVAQKSYTRSGILLKDVTFVEYALGQGGKFATKVKIQNAVYPEYYALIQISDLRKVDSIPDFYFTAEGLADAGNPAK